ncbi:ABC transporter permease subunit [Microcoleus sp. FACHB-SPT15]|uniref:amino acid ABC transporter permease n=1 Tax=Microcoleus sp. FACHB-SPT15 TaxID=2692830 RepID=UPI0017828055|nr:ABC transporter permease subunit [Microcoleus sp. FACHB-SPT15]MBD1807318.1 ABC transporter permease subunit [Microcoleus sp. FACHB-SPT15]
MTTQSSRGNSLGLSDFKNFSTLVRDSRFWKLAGQVIAIVAVGLFFALLWHNLNFNLQRLGIQFGYGFLESQASFDIGESLISFSPSDSFGKAMLVGLVNTLRVSVIGIILATLVGLVVGVARLSDNWLIRKLALVYVEVIRNTPLLLQLFFWYFAVFFQLPSLDAQTTPSSVPFYFTKRGMAVPWLYPTSGTGIWIVLLAIGILAAAWLTRWRTRLRVEQGIPSQSWLWSGGAIALTSLLALIITRRAPFNASIPVIQGTQIQGGLQLSPEIAALLAGLTFFTASFIAEIVRAGIQAVPKGQGEAARALGLKSGIITRRVILPQALRVIVPPLTSQYLNLAKNSSLAIAIGFPDLYAVSYTTVNQTGRAVEVFLIIAGTYLTISLTISLLMNLYNRTVQIKER